MRLVKVLAMVACITCFASLAVAQPEPGDIGVFGDPAGTITTIDAVAFVPFNFYVVGFDQDGGYKGYEFEIQVSPTVTVLARVLNPPTALNVGSGDNFIVGTGGCVSGVGAVVLVDYQALVFAPEFDSPICVTNSTPSRMVSSVAGRASSLYNAAPEPTVISRA